MNCREFQKSLSDLVDGKTDEAKTVSMIQHSRVCRCCENELRYMRNLKTALRTIGGYRVPVDCWGAVSARIVNIHRRPVWQSFLLRYALAPSVAVALLAGYFLAGPNDNTSNYTAVHDQPTFMDYMTIHAGSGAGRPLSDSDTYFVAAGMQDTGAR